MAKTKAYTIYGANGNHLTASEVPERDAIEITIVDKQAGVASVRLGADQFGELVGLGSAYDGLKVDYKVKETA